MDILTLESVIQHCEEVANTNERLCETVRPAMQLSDYGKCAEEHRQLAEWLKELKAYREKQEISTYCVDNHNCNDCIHNTVCTWRGAKFCDWYVQDCNDAISRQDALDCLTATGLKKFDFILYARNKIKNLPSVTPQRTGRWIYDKIDMNGYYLDSYECSVCKCTRNGDTPYCPNCGAKMGVSK